MDKRVEHNLKLHAVIWCCGLGQVMKCTIQIYSCDKRYEEVFRIAAVDPRDARRAVRVNPWLAGPYCTVSLVRDIPE